MRVANLRFLLDAAPLPGISGSGGAWDDKEFGIAAPVPKMSPYERIRGQVKNPASRPKAPERPVSEGTVSLIVHHMGHR